MKIATKINLYFFVLILLGLGVALSLSYTTVKKKLLQAAEEKLLTLLSEKKAHIETYLASLKASANQLAKNPTLETFLQAPDAATIETSGTFEAIASLLARTKEAEPTVVEVMLLDTSGKVTASSGTTPLGADKSSAPYFIGGTRGPYIQDVFLSTEEAKPLLAVGAPVHSQKSGKFLGVLVSLVELNDLNAVAAEKAGLKNTSKTFILNKDGYNVTSLRFLPDDPLKVKLDTLKRQRCLPPPKADALPDKNQVFSAQDYRGEKVLSAGAFIPEMHWCVLSEIDATEAYASLRTIKLIFIFLFLLLSAVGWPAGRLISNGITSPLAKLRQAVETVESGDLNFKIGALSSDEIGELAAAFNRMTERLSGSTISIARLNQEIELRQRTENTLREREAMLRAITDSAQDAILMMNPEGLISYWNASAERILGWNKEEALGQNLHQFLGPQRFQEAYRKAFPHFQKTGQGAAVGKTLELAALRKDGMEIPIELSMTAVKLRNGWHAVGIMRDISERKRTEQEIVRAQKKYTQLFESMSEGLFTADLEGRIISCNEAFKKIIGCGAAECPGACTNDITPEKWRAKEAEIFETQLHPRGYTEVYEKELKRKDGSTFPVAVRAFLLKDEDGRAAGYWALVRDITSAKVMEAAQRQADRMQAIGALAAGIAHEINTPAQFVSDNLGFLRDSSASLLELLNKCAELKNQGLNKSGTDVTIAQIIELCQDIDLDFLRSEFPAAITESLNGIKRISDIVRAMKSFAHPGSEEKKPADINKAIQDTVTVARNEWKYVAEMELNLSPTLPAVPCLLGDFNQVILNLIVNAAYAIGEALKAAPDKEQKGKITISTSADEDWVVIKIADTGIGIPESNRKRVYDPFFTTKPVGKGSGQGLAIAHAVVVEKHNGTIDFESEEGKGTTFTVRLPLKVQPDKGEKGRGNHAA